MIQNKKQLWIPMLPITEYVKGQCGSAAHLDVAVEANCGHEHTLQVLKSHGSMLLFVDEEGQGMFCQV